MLTKEKAMKLFYVETFQFWPQPADWVGWPLSYLCNFQLFPRSTVTSFLKIENGEETIRHEHSEVEFVHAVSAGGSVKFLPAV